MNKRIFTVPAILDGFRPLKDGGASITFHTQELTREDKVEAMEYYDSFGYLLFSKNEIEMSDVPKGNATDDKGKSPSTRLRNTLFVLWKQQGSNGDFESWYKRQMESIIDQVKERLK